MSIKTDASSSQLICCLESHNQTVISAHYYMALLPMNGPEGVKRNWDFSGVTGPTDYQHIHSFTFNFQSL